MNKILFILLIIVPFFAQSQNSKPLISERNLQLLRQYEDTLGFFGDSIVQSADWNIREQACIKFVKTLVRALKIENSFYYPFDSLKTISIVKPEDEKFRIFTWQLTLKDMSYRYYGTLQMSSPQLEMFPLIDMSMFTGNEQDTVLDNNNWYGCIYFNIVMQKYKKKNYYLLFGWDGNDLFSNKKITDVLQFDDAGKPIFGAPVFAIDEKQKPKTRIIIEYKEDASPAMNYDENLDMIVISYLVPENPMSEGIYMTYIPDGTYIGFYFKKGLWHYQKIVFTDTLDAPPDYTPKREGEDPWQYEKK